MTYYKDKIFKIIYMECLDRAPYGQVDQWLREYLLENMPKNQEEMTYITEVLSKKKRLEPGAMSFYYSVTSNMINLFQFKCNLRKELITSSDDYNTYYIYNIYGDIVAGYIKDIKHHELTYYHRNSDKTAYFVNDKTIYKKIQKSDTYKGHTTYYTVNKDIPYRDPIYKEFVHILQYDEYISVRSSSNILNNGSLFKQFKKCNDNDNNNDISIICSQD